MTPSPINRSDYQAATDLITQFGRGARNEAKARANQSRDRGNLIRFCQWRQVERLIDMLAADSAIGTVH